MLVARVSRPHLFDELEIEPHPWVGFLLLLEHDAADQVGQQEHNQHQVLQDDEACQLLQPRLDVCAVCRRSNGLEGGGGYIAPRRQRHLLL